MSFFARRRNRRLFAPQKLMKLRLMTSQKKLIGFEVSWECSNYWILYFPRLVALASLELKISFFFSSFLAPTKQAESLLNPPCFLSFCNAWLLGMSENGCLEFQRLPAFFQRLVYYILRLDDAHFFDLRARRPLIFESAPNNHKSIP